MPLLLLLLALPACSRKSDSAGPSPAVDVPLGPLPRSTAPDAAAPLPPACRLGRAPERASFPDAGAHSPALAWGPGVVGLSYVADRPTRSLAVVSRFVDGTLHGEPALAGEGAARTTTTLSWSGEAFVFAWSEPKDLVPEIFLGRVDAAGSVQWDASRVTETLRTGAWRSPGRTTVESKDPRIIALGNLLLLSWRTRTYPESHLLHFAAVTGLQVSAPVAVTGEADFVIDHQLAPWGTGAAAVYTGRFEKTQRQVRVARLDTSPPAVREDWLVADLAEPPDWFELSVAPEGDDLLVFWRVKTEWNSTANIAWTRVPPAGPAAPTGTPTLLPDVLAATPTSNLPRRSFAALPDDGGFVLAWSVRGDGPGDVTGLRFGRFDAAGAPRGGSFLVSTDTHLARDPVVVRDAEGRIWFAFVYGDPPNETGRVMLGSVICDG